MCQEIKDFLVQHDSLAEYQILEVKEKYGTLRWYDNGGPKGLEQIVNKYEDLSACYCINCGLPTKYYAKGWVEYLCSDCVKQEMNAGKDKSNFVKLKKSHAPVRTVFDLNGLKTIPLDKEVMDLIEENWDNE